MVEISMHSFEDSVNAERSNAMPDLHDTIQYYRAQGAPGDQQMLIALVREAQEEMGGVLSRSALAQIAQAVGWKENTLCALIRRVPSIRLEDAPNRLEICGTCKKGAALRVYIEDRWGVRSGESCPSGGFSYHVTPCMKNCRFGPSIKWDGQLYSHATKELIEQLIAPERTDRSK